MKFLKLTNYKDLPMYINPEKIDAIVPVESNSSSDTINKSIIVCGKNQIRAKETTEEIMKQLISLQDPQI